MRRKEKEITDQSTLNQLINSATVCRLGLARENTPYIVPLSFGFKDNVLYFHSAAEGKKIEVLKVNPNVCFEFDLNVELLQAERPCKWGMKYQSKGLSISMALLIIVYNLPVWQRWYKHSLL